MAYRWDGVEAVATEAAEFDRRCGWGTCGWDVLRREPSRPGCHGGPARHREPGLPVVTPQRSVVLKPA